MDLAQMRKEYESQPLDMADLDPDPHRQFARWFDDVARSEVIEPNAAVLATAGADGRPSARHVLVKAAGRSGFVFYTNYTSRKANQLEVNPYAALVFTWAPLSRQVVVEGRVSRVAPEDSDAYFAQRPRVAQLGAWASNQSRPIADRTQLEASFEAAAQRFDGMAVPRPEHWGGYRVDPQRMEFWQGRLGRLHDRLSYERTGNGWRIERLAP
ncbi:MAG: pyridoxamine 5'-phosphate oxidase [Acidimicrobiia bacterium]